MALVVKDQSRRGTAPSSLSVGWELVGALYAPVCVGRGREMQSVPGRRKGLSGVVDWGSHYVHQVNRGTDDRGYWTYVRVSLRFGGVPG